MKRTALGRIKHENAAFALSRDGNAVVYMGDDERGEFIYKWVSRDVYVLGGDTSTLLTDGQLYVAKFNDDMTGEWSRADAGSTGMSAAEIAIFTRTAGSKVGATTMDRPEWVAVNPRAIEAYCCLTNNSRRGTMSDSGKLRTNEGGDPMALNAPNPRETNNYGQNRALAAGERGPRLAEVRLRDLFVMAGNPTVHKDGLLAGSSNINIGNLFNSPDGMRDRHGRHRLDPDRRRGQQQGRLCRHGQQPDAGRRPGDRRDPPLPDRSVRQRGDRDRPGRRTAAPCSSASSIPMRRSPMAPDTLPRSAIIAIRRDDNAPVG